MADFRKWIIVLAALSLFAGLAGAQSNVVPFQCNATAAVTPQLRSEGLTELVGDIVLTCFGGTPLAAGSPIPTANFTVYTNSTVTSRLLGNGSVSNASEALLLIDDPQTATFAGASYGESVPQTFCGSSNALAGAGVNGCQEFVGNQGAAPSSYAGASPLSPPAFTAGNTLGVPVSGSATSTTVGANVFQGVVSGSSVTFYGIPVMAPVTAGATRIFRMTNIRINANGIGGGSLTPATAQIAITGTAAVPVNNSLLTVGYISTSLSTSVRNAPGDSDGLLRTRLQCSNLGTTTAPVNVETLRWSEVQGSAFKVRGTTGQNLPGQVYTNAESGFVFNTLTGTNSATGIQSTAGYANWGTRLKATFNNVPTGVSLFVSTTNVSGATQITAPTATSTYAVLISGENAPDNGPNGGLAPNTTFPLVSQTGTTGGVAFAPVSVSGGTGMAVYEIANSLQNTPENVDVLLFAQYVASPSTNVPPAPATMTVNLSYAPTPPSFTAASGAVASSTLGIPRFADTSVGVTSLKIAICQTALLYPYVINVAGFDTGLSVANTTTDPFGTGAQNGSCQVYWYGANAPAMGYLGGAGYQTTAPTTAQLMQSGTISSWGASTAAPGFSGYVIALCNFQFAHGFAFVSDIGARNLAMGYLALVIDGGDGGPRGAPVPQEWLGN
jgi:hypothetical protein